MKIVVSGIGRKPQSRTMMIRSLSHLVLEQKVAVPSIACALELSVSILQLDEVMLVDDPGSARRRHHAKAAASAEVAV